MEYIINSTRQENEVVITNTTIMYDEMTSITIDISHYMPKDVNDIHLNIINRSISEKAKMDSINNITNLVNEIPTNRPIDIG